MGELMFFRGRVAMAALLRGLDVGPGDRVAIQAFTCLAVVDAVRAVGAEPTFVDVTSGFVTMDPGRLRGTLDGGEVAAIVVQHTFGVPADLDEILAVARDRDIPVLEDCCHAYASAFGGRRVGSFGAGAFTSYEWGKPLVAGVGGEAMAADEALGARVASIHADARRPSLRRVLAIEAELAGFRLLYRPRTYWPVRRAFRALSRSSLVVGSYRPESDAAGPDPEYSLRSSPLVRRRVRRLEVRRPGVANRALKLAVDYRKLLEGRRRFRDVAAPAGARPVYARYPVLVDDKPGLLRRAESHNLEVADWYTTPVHPLGPDAAARHGYEAGDCPDAERLTRELVSFPIGPKVGARYLRRLAGLLDDFDPAADAVEAQRASAEVTIECLGMVTPPRDLAQVAALHAAVITDGFLASLGTDVLAGVYRDIAQCDDAFIYVARDARGNVLGYLCASIDSRRVRSALLRRSARHVAPVGRALVRRPDAVRRLVETVRYPTGSVRTELPPAEILNFCVAPAHQATGIGARLFGAVLEHYALVGIDEIAIVTGASQQGAQRFYERAGSVEVGRLEVHAGGASIAYVHRTDVRPGPVRS
jgi:dTDP-4-amino-4,6-dideoxygalactose transaminase/ribosomal protein S18 acetylase RimI-like enzyme